MKYLSQLVILLLVAVNLYGQLNGNEKRSISIGSLQSHFTAYGSERAWTGTYYSGLRWPAEYPLQDNAVIKRTWIASQGFTDETEAFHDYYVVHFYATDVGSTLFPAELTQSAKYARPSVSVNGNYSTYLANDIIDTIDPTQNPDRRIINVVNTSMGLTQTREILAFSQGNNDNYFIKIFTYANTGNTDGDPEIELNDSLHGVRIGWGSRYSCGREAASLTDPSQSYGKHSWVSRRGEDYADHYLDPITPENPVAAWLRCGFSWMGQSNLVTWDNIGAPDVLGDGRLASPQFIGSVVLHVDVNANDPSDDISQPVFLGWHAGDTFPPRDNNDEMYNFLAGNPYPNPSMGGVNRMDDALQSITDRLDPYTLHGDGGGTNVMMTYGPFDLAHGESITIVEAEGVNGLSREMCQQIGERWKLAYDNPGDTGPFLLPDGSETADKDIFKNSWVYTGMDSIMLTFSRAKQAFDTNYEIPQAPPPPMVFDIFAEADGINLAWDNTAELSLDFAGYKLYRKQDSYYGAFEEIFSCGNDDLIHSWTDADVVDSVAYYYYLVSWGISNTGEILESGKFYTLTTNPVNLSEQVFVDADLFVNPLGDDGNSGLTASEPLKTITRAVQIILHSELHPNIIHLSSGIYSPSSNGETFPLSLNGHFSISGDTETILNGESNFQVLSISGANNNLTHLRIVNGESVADWPFFTELGGGILIYDGDLSLSNVDIEGCSSRVGGGLWAQNSHLSFSNVNIVGNAASEDGGGLWAQNSRISFSNVNIVGNTASDYGGGIGLENCEPLIFDELNPTSIYENSAGLGGFDLYDANPSALSYNVVVDSFSVSSPSDYHAFPLSSFTFAIDDGIHTQQAHDIYVSPSGDDLNSGLDSSQAFRSIAKAIQMILTSAEQPGTIFLAQGVYAASTTGEQFPVLPRDNLTIKGVSRELTILDGDQGSGLVEIRNHTGVSLEDMGLRNAMISGPGAAIYANDSHFSLTNLFIEDNVSESHNGSIFLDNQSHTELTNVTIRNNHGRGIVVENNSTLEMSTTDRCNIYNNTAHSYPGKDIRSSEGFLPHSIILDTFTVQFPTEEYAYPIPAYTFDIFNGKIPQAEADLYVSPTGNDENTGLSPDQPLKTIAYANDLIFGDESRPHTIHLLEGTYSIGSNGETLPVRPRSFISIAGDPDGGTIIDGEGQEQAIVCDDITSVTLSDIIVRRGISVDGAGISCSESDNIALLNVVLDGNVSSNYGGAIFATHSSISVGNSFFMNNRGNYGAGLALIDSDLNMLKSVFHGDSAKFGSAIYLKRSTADLDKLTITDNLVGIRGAALTLWESSQVTLRNSILWENDSESLYIRPGNNLHVSYSDVQEGASAGSGDSLYWLTGNIDTDPLFCSMEEENYQLAASSPCVTAGEDGLNMGALDIGCTVALDDFVMLPLKLTLQQNYPNPFNPMTTIKYGLPESAEFSLTIFDIRGRMIKTFAGIDLPAGWYEMIWSGLDDSGRPVSTGVYFCRLKSASQTEAIKMLYLK
ncbi:MAG: DUF1565 domain-containing protein [Candidatus Marinimicrobia bacterium]|nr:DUF1565 domain-containing protein [Candidatus Neomarinimicrobiota bacterium]